MSFGLTLANVFTRCTSSVNSSSALNSAKYSDSNLTLELSNPVILMVFVYYLMLASSFHFSFQFNPHHFTYKILTTKKLLA